MNSALRTVLSCSLLWSLLASANAQTLRTVALFGQQAPGTPSGVNFGQFSAPSLNAAGQTAFYASTYGAEFTHGIWSEESGGLQLVARTGMQAPGTANGVTYSRFTTEVFSTTPSQPPIFNDAGQVTFDARVAGAGVNSTNDMGIWVGSAGGLSLVAREGSPAPGIGGGVTYSSVQAPRLNNAGQVAFIGPLAGNGITLANDSALWLSGNNVELVARDGEQAPGTPAGVVFSNPLCCVLNSSGQIAFQSSLAGTGVLPNNNSGIWSGSPGNLRLVARQGSPAPDMLPNQVFSSFGAPAINDASQTAFRGEVFIPGAGSRGAIWSEGSGELTRIALAGDFAPGTPDGVTFNSFGSVVLNAAGKVAFRAILFPGGDIDISNNQGIWTNRSGELELVVREGDPAPGMPEGVFLDEFDIQQFPVAFNAAGQIALQLRLTGTGVHTANDEAIWATDDNGEFRLIVREGDVLEVAPGDFRTVSSLRFGLFNNFGAEDTGNEDGRVSGFNDRGQLAFQASFTGDEGGWGIFVSDLVAAPHNLPGDFDGDGDVDGRDFLTWQRNPSIGSLADWQANYGGGGSQTAASAAVPEPASLMLMMLAMGGMLWSSRRGQRFGPAAL